MNRHYHPTMARDFEMPTRMHDALQIDAMYAAERSEADKRFK